MVYDGNVRVTTTIKSALRDYTIVNFDDLEPDIQNQTMNRLIARVYSGLLKPVFTCGTRNYFLMCICRSWVLAWSHDETTGNVQLR